MDKFLFGLESWIAVFQLNLNGVAPVRQRYVGEAIASGGGIVEIIQALIRGTVDGIIRLF